MYEHEALAGAEAMPPRPDREDGGGVMAAAPPVVAQRVVTEAP